MMKVCVFCSANEGLPTAVLNEAERFCDELKSRGGELLYGGGKAGLMGYFADQALKRGVPVRGAITRGLADGLEVAHQGLTELHIVNDLFDRKRWFLEQSDAFCVFPGGFGTLDEALEVITWKSLKELEKPIVFVNIEGFWDSILQSFHDLAQKRVIRPGGQQTYSVANSSREAFELFNEGSKK
jgi:uncharacterized protein (TIGR00730 family)